MVSEGLGGDYEGNVENNENLEDLPSLPPEITIDGLTLDELEDLKLIAENEGISFAEAIDRFGWQNEFAQFADKIEEAYPNSFAGAGLYSDGKGAWIAFKENIEACKKSCCHLACNNGTYWRERVFRTRAKIGDGRYS